MWTFRDYVAPSGRNFILDWYNRASPQVRADFDRMLQLLERTKEWKYPAFERLKGKKYQGLGEIRWHTDKVQHRVIGCNGPKEAEYTLLIGCTHKGKIYDPPNALETAAQRMKSLRKREGSTREHES